MSELVSDGHVHQVPPHAQPYLVAQPDRFSQFMIRLWHRSPRWAAPALILLCFTGGVAYTVLSDPADANAFSSPTCLVKLTTGFDCPGCGGTRAFWYLLHGNIPAAARSHIMAVFAAPFLAYMYVAWSVNLMTGKGRLPVLRLSPKTISIFLAVWGVFSVLRNLPWAPFTWLYV
jgi:Protein of unknown function (DUF2752)